MSLGSRAATIAIVAGLLAASAAIVIGLAAPVWSQVLEANAATAAASATASDLEVQREHLKQFANDKDANRALSARLSALIPKTAAIDPLIVSLEQLGEALSVRLVVLSAKTNAAAKGDTTFTALPAGTQSVQLSLELSGSYPQIQNFIRQLALQDRLIDIGTLSLTAAPDVGVSAHLETRTFSKPKTTVQESSQALTIDPKLRAALLAPRSLVPLAAQPAGTTGRGDPFAPVP